MLFCQSPCELVSDAAIRQMQRNGIFALATLGTELGRPFRPVAQTINE
jgi:hypothetical protein